MISVNDNRWEGKSCKGKRKTGGSRGPAGIKQVRPQRSEIQIKYYWKLLSVGRTETAMGQIGQNQSSYELSELRTVILYSTCLQPSFRSSAKPKLEEKQMEHVTGFLLPKNVDNITPGFQRHNHPSKCSQLFLTLTFSFSPLTISCQTHCVPDPCLSSSDVYKCCWMYR